MTILSIDNVSFKYSDRWILQNIDFTVQKDDFIGIVGPNGGGKSTLLKLILGLLKPVSGKITIRTDNHLPAPIGYVPQLINFDPKFPITVKEVVQFGLIETLGKRPFFNHETAKKTSTILEKFHLSEFSNHLFGELSGGLKQRALIARAVINTPALLLLDEPTANVDGASREHIHDLLNQLKASVTILLVSHNPDFITTSVNKVACINRNLVLHGINEIRDDLLKNRYGYNVYQVDHSNDCCRTTPDHD